ncbi:polyamine aminopropyltransferase [Inhella gelatinilytica]|uniref:Polyamine aminopropyltransferase n=1 Tax=Inhella gelatinilytica TaxID=2795030 RepID=A0A931NEI4_9BURK|nr:polyamine aminopropyltransferase [Inhella gelatinilytica]MBH9554192.1 polyamine aminopropyltransferase [Inhella gelatinilytica]
MTVSESRARISLAEVLLLVSVFLIAACGLAYELAAGALASYLLGDSVLQFSTVIGSYLFALGIGAWLSRFIERQLVAVFLRVELLVGVLGGLLPMGLFAAHSLMPLGHEGPFRVLLYALVLLVGSLVGLEIPLVMRILKQHASGERGSLRELVAQVLTFDYLGALLVALAFPLLLVPHLGLVRTGLFFGLINLAVACWALWLFRQELRRWAAHAAACAASIVLLCGAWAASEALTDWAEQRFYGEPLVLRASSPYQRVVVTEGRTGVKLYLNGNLQFHERDEYRYHEALVHPALAAHGAPRRVLVLGGGDGLAIREILRYPGVESVTLVELDESITRLAQGPLLSRLNQSALRHPKVQVVHADAYRWLETQPQPGGFDVVIADFPDPSNHALGKLYSTSFYQRVLEHLSASGILVVQSTSPLIARRSFWTVVDTLEAVGLSTTPYHALVPSFGEWGFVMASHRPWKAPPQLPSGLRFLTPKSLPQMMQFPPDMDRVPGGINRLSDPVLVTHFLEEWGKAH